MQEIKDFLKGAIEKTIDNASSDEMMRRCEMAWNKGYKFGLLIGWVIGAIGMAIVYLLSN